MACENCQSKDRVLILLVAMMTVIGAAIVALVDRMSSIEAYTSLQEQCNGYISMANSQLVLASQNCRRDYGDNNISISSYCYMRCDDDRPA